MQPIILSTLLFINLALVVLSRGRVIYRRAVLSAIPKCQHVSVSMQSLVAQNIAPYCMVIARSCWYVLVPMTARKRRPSLSWHKAQTSFLFPPKRMPARNPVGPNISPPAKPHPSVSETFLTLSSVCNSTLCRRPMSSIWSNALQRVPMLNSQSPA
jgi:hypothetical protein